MKECVHPQGEDRAPAAQGEAMSERSDFDCALDFVVSWEGGVLVDRSKLPDERISERANPDLWAQGKIDMEATCELYHERYWLAAGCDGLPWPLCLVVFHIAVQTGPRRARRLRSYNERLFPGLPSAPPTVRALILLSEYSATLDILIAEHPQASRHREGWMRRIGDLARVCVSERRPRQTEAAHG